ncbi:bromodomain-containing protein 3-like [Drosophila kikkawai]|uniref:Bromodomain-containing protein 3-like n=1 Tax=Drosophila kikkawai TaxID=30033 RepID=A0A6P4IMW1_DROKI|nr:bromodomain-containing protein 2-like [Drosophila kikkawai]
MARVEPFLLPVNGIVQPPVHPNPNRPGRRTNILDSLKTLLADIWKQPWAFHFHHPVNAITLGVPTYHKLIRRPMDLSTIKMRLNCNYYYQADEAIGDFKRIYENCLLFNPKGNVVHTAGLMLRSFFNERLAQIDLTNEVEVVEKPKTKTKRKKEPPEGSKPQTLAKKPLPGIKPSIDLPKHRKFD